MGEPLVAARMREAVEVCAGRLRLHFEVAGDGPPLVFFHPLSGPTPRPLLDALAGGRTVHAPEHPGTSPEDPEAIHEVQSFWELLLAYEEALRSLGLARRAVAIGESFGGMVAADLAACFPELFERLVLLSPVGVWLEHAPLSLMGLLMSAPEERPGYLYAHPERAPAPPEDPDQLAQGVWNIGCTTKFAWPVADHGLARRLHRIAVPTLIIAGRQDRLVPPAYAEEFGRLIASSRVELLEDCGHVVAVDQPERTLALIDGFLTG